MTDVAKARTWLSSLPVTPASDRRPQGAVHIAFTMQGLKLLGRAESEYVPEFAQGMSGTDHRRRLLGDEDAKWDWGGPETPIDAALLLYAADAPALDALEAKIL